jgi:hypothetical protein
MPAFGKAIMKKDVYKIHNAKSLNEMDGIADMAYDAPIKDNPMEIDNPKGSTGTIMGNKKMDSKSIAVKKKNFPKYGGPESKFVSIDAKQTFPYSNQGDPKNSSLYEIKGMKEAINAAAKKYGLTVEQVEKIIIKESKQLSERLPVGMWDDGNNRAIKSWTDTGNTDIFRIVTEKPLDIKTKDDVDVAKLKVLLNRYDIKFQIEVDKTGAELKTLGSGGSEVGAYGGTTPYVISGIPPIPSIVDMINTGTGDNTNPVKVTVSVKSNN